MEFLAEIVLECLGELIIEGGAHAASNRRLPRWVRVLILAGLALLFAAAFAVILLVGIAGFRKIPLFSLLLFALDAMLVFLCVRRLRKILRTFSHQ